MFVSRLDGSRLNGILFCRRGVAGLPFLILCFVEAPYMSMFCELFAHFPADVISIETMFSGLEILESSRITWNCRCKKSLSDLLKAGFH